MEHSVLQSHEGIRRCDLDCRAQAAKQRAFVCENTVHTFYGVAHAFRRLKLEGYVDPANHQDTVFGFDLTTHVRSKTAIARVDLARFQRAPEGSDHSTGCSRHHVIDCCRVRFSKFVFVNSIVLGDRAMYAESDRFVFTR
jgi:hypothetical protein